jgi:hypothetical protein
MSILETCSLNYNLKKIIIIITQQNIEINIISHRLVSGIFKNIIRMYLETVASH